ncbi:MAG: molybdenum cofactor guanylyltransferase MobA [Bauldia sp.]
MSATPPIAGVILAGGLSRRMGGDKSLMPLAGRPLIAHAIERLRPQVDELAINANDDPARFAAFGLPIVPDTTTGHAGPLAGILAGMQWASGMHVALLATVSVDAPFFPQDLVARLSEATDGQAIAVARSAGRVHPVFGLFPVRLAGDLEGFLRRDERRSVTGWLAGQAMVAVDFEGSSPGSGDPFFNINTPEDLAVAARAIPAHNLQNR